MRNVSSSSPWPFTQWGLDIIGPLPMATGKRKFLLMGTDYFTKWIEAEPLAKITESNVEKFVWQNIITRFGVPYCIISDNGAQFGPKFEAFCAQHGIQNYYSTRHTPRVTDRQKPLTKQSSRESSEGWRKRRAIGPTNFR